MSTPLMPFARWISEISTPLMQFAIETHRISTPLVQFVRKSDGLHTQLRATCDIILIRTVKYWLSSEGINASVDGVES